MKDFKVFHNFDEIVKQKYLQEEIYSVFDILKRTNKISYQSTSTSPKFDLVVKRDYLSNLQHFIISFHNIKDSFTKFKELPQNPLESLHKCAITLLQQNSLPPNLTLNEIINLLKEKSLEKKLFNSVIFYLFSYYYFFNDQYL